MNDKFLPNRSFYLGGDLILRVNEAETNIQVYNLVEDSISSTSISILNSKLVYDYSPLVDEEQTVKWLVSACRQDKSLSI